jgi:DNA-binding transcriptional ArsR family regulator
VPAIQAPQSNTSRHLATLRDRGLIKADRHGSSVAHSLRHPKIVDAIDLLRQVMADEHSRQQLLRSCRRRGA